MIDAILMALLCVLLTVMGFFLFMAIWTMINYLFR